jgi:hypothetical protein
MYQRLLKHFILTFYSVSIINIINAQVFSQSGINTGVKIGVSKLLGEIPYGFSEIINEYDNKTGFSADLEFSKYLSPHWEVGSEIGFSNLMGNTFTPEFSAEGLQDGIPAEIIEPVEYSNKLLGQNLFFRYFFKPYDSESLFVPFVRAGGGYLSFHSKFKYIDAPDNDLLFGKGTAGYSNLTIPVFFLGTGFKTPISQHIYLVTSIDFNMVNYDFLDVMHNYSDEGNRLELIGLYTEFKIGIFYNFNKSGDNKSKQNNQNTSQKGSLSANSYLPFSR